MAVESATYINELDASKPAGSDYIYEGDNHIQLIKSVIKATFPNIAGAMTATHTELNQLAGNPNFDSGVLYVDKTNNRVGVNKTTPSAALDVTGTLNVTGAVTTSSSLTTGAAIVVDPSTGGAFIVVDKASATDYASIYGKKAGAARWELVLGNGTAESVDNAGSDFNLYAYNDAGSYLSTPLSISRSTGNATFSQTVTAGTYFVAGDGYGLRFGDGTARIYGSGSSDTISFYVDATEYYRMTTSTLRPGADNALTCGASGYRWSSVWAATGTIQTSDAREKTAVRSLTNAELAAARRMAGELGLFQWLSSIEEKGEAEARLHCGIAAQRVESILREQGLDPFRYAFLCYDAEPDQYSLRLDQLALFIARGLDARLRALEQQQIDLQWSLMGDR